MNRFITYDEVVSLTNSLQKKMLNDQWYPEIVVGISRGGLVPAIHISHMYDIPMEILKVNLRDNTSSKPESHPILPSLAATGKNILIVDDINDSGSTINWIIDDWCNKVSRAVFDSNVRFGVLFNKESSCSLVVPSYIGETIFPSDDRIWIIFPWEV